MRTKETNGLDSTMLIPYDKNLNILKTTGLGEEWFGQSAVAFLKDNNFDGLDLDWEYPTCWQVDCSAGPASDKEAYTAWVKELREAMDAEDDDLVLTAAVSPSSEVIQKAYNIPELSKYLDYLSVMTYDYHGQWDKQTGHVAPIYEHPDDLETTFNMVNIYDDF